MKKFFFKLDKVLVSFFFFYTSNLYADSNHGSITWHYEGKEGPQNWGKIAHDFEKCSNGHYQSPVNINKNLSKKNSELPYLNFEYKNVLLSIINNGHTIQVDYPEGSSLSIGKERFSLLQFHFHTPSEHAFNEIRSEMEVHFVHKDKNNVLSVVGILMEKGKRNKEMDVIFENLPTKHGETKKFENTKINALDFFPKESRLFNYKGSLTTPPCSEGVNWYVLNEKIEVSSEQIQKFKKLFKMNARPLQSIGSRKIDSID